MKYVLKLEEMLYFLFQIRNLHILITHNWGFQLNYKLPSLKKYIFYTWYYLPLVRAIKHDDE